MGNFFESLEHTSWVMTIAETGWLYAAVSVTHYFTLFVLVGTIVLVDLRILGVAARSQSVTQVADSSCLRPTAGTIIRTVSFA